MKNSSTKLLLEMKHFETPLGTLIAIPLNKSPICFTDILSVLQEKIPEKILSRVYLIMQLKIRKEKILYRAFLSNGKSLRPSVLTLNLICLVMDELEQK